VKLMRVQGCNGPRRSPRPLQVDHRYVAHEMEPRAGQWEAGWARDRAGFPVFHRALAHMPLDQVIHQQPHHVYTPQGRDACAGLQEDGRHGGRVLGPPDAQLYGRLLHIGPHPRGGRPPTRSWPDKWIIPARSRGDDLGSPVDLPADPADRAPGAWRNLRRPPTSGTRVSHPVGADGGGSHQQVPPATQKCAVSFRDSRIAILRLPSEYATSCGLI
jgi:hypothetical protein